MAIRSKGKGARPRPRARQRADRHSKRCEMKDAVKAADKAAANMLAEIEDVEERLKAALEAKGGAVQHDLWMDKDGLLILNVGIIATEEGIKHIQEWIKKEVKPVVETCRHFRVEWAFYVKMGSEWVHI